MKKKLEAELISIAHKILKMKNKDDVHQLYLESQKLYEKLAVLVFVEDNFDIIKPTINKEEVESKLEQYNLIPEVDSTITPVTTDNTNNIVSNNNQDETLNEVTPQVEANTLISETDNTPTPVVSEDNNDVPSSDTQDDIYNALAKLVEENKIKTEAEIPPIADNTTPEVTATTTEEEIISSPNAALPEKEDVIYNRVGIQEFPEPLSESAEQKRADIFSKLGIEDEETLEKKRLEKRQIMMNELLDYTISEPVFEKVNSVVTPDATPTIKEESIEIEANKIKNAPVEDYFTVFPDIRFEKKHETVADTKVETNLNEKIGKSTGLSLNDRMAFEKNLFDGSTEDLNRVISQIATFDTFQDARNFIEEMVKPDYNEWRGKEEFANRFMEFVESKFV
ncbi:MAG: hypothetical protein QM535_03590 [Limnohabitans sp.]|nr:hypothetical protein [Limnohabitans sp.]